MKRNITPGTLVYFATGSGPTMVAEGPSQDGMETLCRYFNEHQNAFEVVSIPATSLKPVDETKFFASLRDSLVAEDLTQWDEDKLETAYATFKTLTETFKAALTARSLGAVGRG